MGRAGWIYVGVNMMGDDHRRLEVLAEMWGLSKAAAVRRLLKEATPALDDRNGHTCPEGQYAKWGTSNPMQRERCSVCWPTMPTMAERHDAEKSVFRQQHWNRLHDGVAIVAPWWYHVKEARRLAQEED